MAAYVGSATSRVNCLAKVAGAARYAVEYNAPGLVHASMVGATIAKGRVTRIDATAALRVDGVITMLTHENRPPMADNDQAYKDDVAPEGSPFRPLYDGSIMFNGQPIALVVADTLEVACCPAAPTRNTPTGSPGSIFRHRAYRSRSTAGPTLRPGTIRTCLAGTRCSSR